MEIDKELLRLARAVADASSILESARASYPPDPNRVARLEKALERKMKELGDYNDAKPEREQTQGCTDS
jgi:hypothetical protein